MESDLCLTQSITTQPVATSLLWAIVDEDGSDSFSRPKEKPWLHSLENPHQL